jgi:hypothetical protein
MDECDHLFKRLRCHGRGEMEQQTFTLALKDGHVDLATSLAVLSDELMDAARDVRVPTYAPESP